MPFKSYILAVLLLSSLAGCAPPRPVELDVKGIKPSPEYADLAAVLAQAVDRKGQVLPEALERCAGQLDRQLRLLAVTGPTATPALYPRAEDRLAYWYNASAAWSMKLAMLEKFPEEMDEAALHDRSFPLDGRQMTLRQVSASLRKDPDFRVSLLAPCVCVQEGALPATPLIGGEFRARLDAMFNQYIADPKRLVVDVEGRRMIYPPSLWRLRQELIHGYQQRYHTEQVTLTTALMPYVHDAAMRKLQDAIGYSETGAQERGLLALPGKFSFLYPRK